MLNLSKLKETLRVGQEATQGEWSVEGNQGWVKATDAGCPCDVCEAIADNDATAIAALHNALPDIEALIDAYESLTKIRPMDTAPKPLEFEAEVLMGRHMGRHNYLSVPNDAPLGATFCCTQVKPC